MPHTWLDLFLMHTNLLHRENMLIGHTQWPGFQMGMLDMHSNVANPECNFRWHRADKWISQSNWNTDMSLVSMTNNSFALAKTGTFRLGIGRRECKRHRQRKVQLDCSIVQLGIMNSFWQLLLQDHKIQLDKSVRQ